MVLKFDSAGQIGSSCSIINDSSATVSSTSISPADSSAIASNSNAIISSSSSSTYDTNATLNIQCSNLKCSLQPLNNQKPTVNDSSSNKANNLFEPNETAELFSTLENTGAEIASSISANLSTTDTTINQSTDTYANINPGNSQTCSLCYSITPQDSLPSAHWDVIVS